jgi:hypothetical protein
LRLGKGAGACGVSVRKHDKWHYLSIAHFMLPRSGRIAAGRAAAG